MGYYQQPQQGMGSRVKGIIVLCAMLIIIAMVIYICFTVLGATFSAFDKLTYLLSSTPLAVYDNLRSTTVGIFQVFLLMIPLSALGILIAAIYKLKNGEEG